MLFKIIIYSTLLATTIFAKDVQTKPYSIFTAISTESLLVFKDKNDLQKWAKEPSNKSFLIKLYKQNKMCNIPKNTHLFAMRDLNYFQSFNISNISEQNKCSGVIHEAYLHDKIKNIEKYTGKKNDNKKNLYKYYKSLDATSIAKEISTMFSESAPFRLDRLTIFDSVYSLKNNIFINKSMIASIEQDKNTIKDILKNENSINALKNNLFKQDTESLCIDKLYKIFFSKQGRIIYKWKIYDNDKIVYKFSHSISQKDCK